MGLKANRTKPTTRSSKMYLTSSTATTTTTTTSLVVVVVLQSMAIVSQAVVSSNSSPQLNYGQIQQQQQQHHLQAMQPMSQQEESELMRQKQHIQYHDQWPSMAGKCRKRTLNFCASVLPFNSTTFPNIIGDTNRFEVKRSLPFFGFLAKSSCNKRLDELLCLLLEPPCQQSTGLVIPPCKKFCRLALEGCSEYIPATLAMSSVFDCRQYPDSSDPSVCINLASGARCAQDEFKCPDKTCIPKTWLCDGVRDCLFAADEANCTEPAGLGPQASVCSTEEFKCDGKCVPKAWKCDGERDCSDGTDEEGCDRRPRCGPDRFRCADGNGCLPKRWVCDGKAECRDGSDELNCEQRECSENDFKCDNGICIPKIWKCDRQFDCKDASDERGCTYPISSTSTTTTSTMAPTTVEQMANVSLGAFYQLPAELDQESAARKVAALEGHSYAGEQETATKPAAADLLADSRQLGASLNEDVSRIIQQESGALSNEPDSARSDKELEAGLKRAKAQAQVDAEQQAKELKKFDYDLLPSSSAPKLAINQQHPQEEAPGQQEQPMGVKQPQQMLTQVDFVGQPAVAPAASHNGFRRRTSKPVQSQPLAAPATATATGQPAERVPIYRSLFKKTPKSDISAAPSNNQQQQQQPGNSGQLAPGNSQQASHRYAVRRRRDRAQQRQHLQQQQRQLGPTPQQGQEQLAAPEPAGSMRQPTRSAAGVASYLQLLNSRYNFRLSRAAQTQQPQQPQQQQPQQQQSPHSVSFVPSS